MLKIPGYEDRPLVQGSTYLDDPLFWPVHLGTSLRGEDARRAVFGADWDTAMDLYRVLSAQSQGQWAPARWRLADGVWINDGGHSYRNPGNTFALPEGRLLEISNALDGGEATDHRTTG